MATAHILKLQVIATHCNTLQHTATQALQGKKITIHGNSTHKHTASNCKSLQPTAIHCNKLHLWQVHTHTHTATHYNLLQLTATHCNTLQHTATQALQGKDITIYGNGEATRSFQYVDDLVAGDLQQHCNILQDIDDRVASESCHTHE